MKQFLVLIAALGFSAVVHAQNAMGQKPTMPALSDGEISEALLTINEGEIDAGQIANGKVKNNDVKNFANMMIDGHKKNIKETKAIAKKAKIDIKKSDLSKQLKEDMKTANKDLKKNNKETMDRAYVDQQVMLHEKALATLNETLIPNVSNADMKAHLERTRADVEEHLSHARKLQTDLK